MKKYKATITFLAPNMGVANKMVHQMESSLGFNTPALDMISEVKEITNTQTQLCANCKNEIVAKPERKRGWEHAARLASNCSYPKPTTTTA